MTVFIAIVVACVVIWLISLLFEWISDHKEAILGFVGLIVAGVVLIYFGPKIWSFIMSGLQSALSAWPVLLLVLACIGLYKRNQAKKLQEFVLWINRVGLAEKSAAQVSQAILDLAEKNETIMTLGSRYILSMNFYKQLHNWLEQPAVVSKEIFQDRCLQFALDFQSTYSELLFNIFSNSDKLLYISGSDGIYFSNGLKNTYVDRFRVVGAATEDEFADVCKDLNAVTQICLEPQVVATAVLDYLVSKGDIETVELKDAGTMLFMHKRPYASSNFMRREISMDD